jgi:CheY-like chemotaxis protein
LLGERCNNRSLVDAKILSFKADQSNKTDHDNLALFYIWLKKSGAEVKTLTSSREVIETIQNFVPHVILSDISMPDEDGYSLITRVRSLPHSKGGTIPAAAVTCHDSSSDRSLSFKAGFQMHIPKPVSSTMLVTAVHALANLGSTAGH